MPVGRLEILNVITTLDDGTNSGTATITAVNTTAGTMYYKVDNGSYQASELFTGLSDGFHTAYVQVVYDSEVYNDNFSFTIEQDITSEEITPGDKYIVEFESVQTKETETIRILKKGYTGAITYLTGNGDPAILTHEEIDLGLPRKFATIIASKLEINLRSVTQDLYNEFYSFDDREYLVIREVDDVEKWRGYLVTDSFTESYISPSELTLVATDGLTNLQNEQFKNSAGEFYKDYIKESDIITQILNKTGLDIAIHDSVNIYDTEMNDTQTTFSPFVQAYISCEMHNDYDKNTADDCLKVLHNILLKYNAYLILENGVWNIHRNDKINIDYVKRKYDINWSLSGNETVSPVKSFSSVKGSRINFSEHTQIKETIPAISKLVAIQNKGIKLSMFDGEFITNRLVSGVYGQWTDEGNVIFSGNQARLINNGSDAYLTINVTSFNYDHELNLKYEHGIGATSTETSSYRIIVRGFNELGVEIGTLKSDGTWATGDNNISVSTNINKDATYRLTINEITSITQGNRIYFTIEIHNNQIASSLNIEYVRLLFTDVESDEVPFIKESSLKILYQPDDIEFIHSDVTDSALNRLLYNGGIKVGVPYSFLDNFTSEWTDAIYTDTLINIFLNKVMYQHKKTTWMLTGQLVNDTPISMMDVFLESSRYFKPLRMVRSLKHNKTDVDLLEFLQYPDVPTGDFLLLNDTEYILMNDSDFILISD